MMGRWTGFISETWSRRSRSQGVPRAVLAFASGLAAAVHLWALPHHLADSTLFGTAFAFMALAQGAWASAILSSRARWTLVTGIVLNLAILGVWISSRTVGLPVGPDAWVPEPIGAADLMASVCELVVVAVASAALRGRLPIRPVAMAWTRLPGGLKAGFALLGTGFILALAPGHGGHSAAAHSLSPGHLVVLVGMVVTMAGVVTSAIHPSAGSRSRERSTT